MSGYDKSRIVGMSDGDLDEFICGICQEIFNTPVVTHCCGQTFCKACIEEWLSNNNNCPNDRKLLRIDDLKPVPRFAANFLNNMKIKCEYEERGCKRITAISELMKHQKECEYRPDIECKSCGLPQEDNELHNCIENLIIKNNSIVSEMTRLQKEIKELKSSNNKTNLGMTAVLESVRNSIDDYVIGEPLLKINLYQKRILINFCKEAILGNDSYPSIAQWLSARVNSSIALKNTKEWQVISFSNEGGESLVYSDQYFRIEFTKLIIEIFTSKADNQLTRLQKENQELKQNMNTGMSGLLETVRNSINDFVIGEPRHRIKQEQKQLLIQYCQDAIKENNCFEDIAKWLYFKIRSSSAFKGPKPWHVIAFSKGGGESLVVNEQYLRIEFNKIVIEVFTSSN